MRTTLARPIALVGAAAAALLIAGCGNDVQELLRDAGDTPCGEYLEQEPADQTATITDFLKEQSEDDTEPDTVTVDVTKYAVMLLCQAEGNKDTPISEADLNIAPPAPQN
jgi:acid stress chaperone HdeA